MEKEKETLHLSVWNDDGMNANKKQSAYALCVYAQHLSTLSSLAQLESIHAELLERPFLLFLPLLLSLPSPSPSLSLSLSPPVSSHMSNDEEVCGHEHCRKARISPFLFLSFVVRT